MGFMSVRDWIAIAAGFMGFTLVFVVGGTAATWVHSGVVPAIGVAEMPIVALKTVANLSDPALGWPVKYQKQMPGPGLFYAGWVTVVAVVGLAGFLARNRVDMARLKALAGSERDQAETARWAKAKDLRKLFVQGPVKGRLVMGRFDRGLLAAEERQSVLVAAPSQSGKTTGLVVPAILEWDGPVIATSVKGDLLDDTMRARASRGRVMVFDPTDACGYGSIQATPLSTCGTWQEARRTAHWLAEARKPATSENADFWFRLAEKLLAPVMFAARLRGWTMEDVVRVLDAGPAAAGEIEEILEGREKALLSWTAIQGRDEKHLSSVYATAEQVVECFADPKVSENSREAGFSPMDLMDGKSNTLFLVAPPHEQKRLAPLFASMIQSVINVTYGIAAEKRSAVGEGGIGKALDPPLLLALDELANIAPIPDLDTVASTGAAQGIQLLSVVQDFSQLKERFGPLKAQTIINNHRAIILGSGQKDPETLEYVQKVSGSAEYAQRSETVGHGRESKTEGSTFRDLAPANVVREQQQNEAVLIYGALPPARLKLRPWYQDRRLTSLVKETR